MRAHSEVGEHHNSSRNKKKGLANNQNQKNYTWGAASGLALGVRDAAGVAVGIVVFACIARVVREAVGVGGCPRARLFLTAALGGAGGGVAGAQSGEGIALGAGRALVVVEVGGERAVVAGLRAGGEGAAALALALGGAC